jgi:DNA-binding CsgD family transcriptional regulator
MPQPSFAGAALNLRDSATPCCTTNCVAKAMTYSAEAAQLRDVVVAASEPDHIVQVLEMLPRLGDAQDAGAAVDLFQQILILLGVGAGVFLSFIRDDSTRSSYRSLLACDPLWAVEYAKGGWYDRDPWLRHALNATEPIRATELQVLPEEEDFVRAASSLGFASAVIIPAPSSAGPSRVGVLCLGSQALGFFEGDGYARLRVIARALAMELHRWLLQNVRAELLGKSRITPAEIELLRHEEAGHTSKVIAAVLDIEAKTVDCRFQRLSAKLDAPDRRTAARIARLYGLL